MFKSFHLESKIIKVYNTDSRIGTKEAIARQILYIQARTLGKQNVKYIANTRFQGQIHTFHFHPTNRKSNAKLQNVTK